MSSANGQTEFNFSAGADRPGAAAPQPGERQALVLTDHQLGCALTLCAGHRWPARDKVMVLLAFKAGLSPLEISRLRRLHVLGANGQLSGLIDLRQPLSKRLQPRVIPLHPALAKALDKLFDGTAGVAEHPLIRSERALRGSGTGLAPMEAKSVGYFFYRLFQKLDLPGACAFSGRRSFITQLARATAQVEATLRDVQHLAGHRSAVSTLRAIEPAAWLHPDMIAHAGSGQPRRDRLLQRRLIDLV